MQIILNTFRVFWSVVKFFLIPFGIAFALFCAVYFVWFVVYSAKGNRLPHGAHKVVKRPGFIRSFFWDAPQRYWDDEFSRNPDFFRHQGCIIFTGRQGYGKTISMVEQTLIWQKEYPLVKCISNVGYEYADAELNDWRQLVDYSNGIYGVIVQMDETQNWFSSNQSKDFPPQMLEVVTQNRKNKRVILGTAQSFNRLAKPLREQATEVRRCLTILHCFTIVHRVEPELDSTGEVVKWKHRGFYFFAHTDKIRECFDTYKVIQGLKASGFQPVVSASDLALSLNFQTIKKK